MNKDLEQELAKTSTALDAMVESHYKPLPDNAMLLEGRYGHRSALSEWSLSSVNKISDSCRNALFGTPAPKDSQKRDVGPTVATAITAIASRELFIANTAFNVIQGILGSFNSFTSTSAK